MMTQLNIPKRPAYMKVDINPHVWESLPIEDFMQWRGKDKTLFVKGSGRDECEDADCVIIIDISLNKQVTPVTLMGHNMDVMNAAIEAMVRKYKKTLN